MIKTKDLSIRTGLQIMLLVACLGSIVVVGMFSWIRARDILSERILSQLTSERASKAYQIEAYFTALSNQIETLCEDRMVVEAMREFDAEFEKLKGRSITPEETAGLETYYTKKFLPRLAKNIKGDPAYETYRPNSGEALYLQYHYMANNPEEVGKKAKMEKAAGDESGYSKVHESYQELFHGLVTRLGYYDLFLIDPETGEIVYSVHKETDFATNLYNGPYRNSNLAEVVKRVRDDPDRGAIQIVDYQFYRPSSERLVAHLSEVDFLGEMVLLAGEPSPVTATVHETATGLRIDSAAINALVQRIPRFALEISQFIDDRRKLTRAV